MKNVPESKVTSLFCILPLLEDTDWTHKKQHIL